MSESLKKVPDLVDLTKTAFTDLFEDLEVVDARGRGRDVEVTQLV